MMSRRKQQNPKPLKYNESVGLTPSNTPDCTEGAAVAESADSSTSSPKSVTADAQPLISEEDETIIKHEPESPEQTISPSGSLPTDYGPSIPPTLQPNSLENLLGVPDDAPLRVESCPSGGYKILSAKYIAQGAGLDPLKAQRIDSSEDVALLNNKPQVVSFLQKQQPDSKVYFQLESSINCAWLKCLGEPSENSSANINIYYAGDQLWVEVAEDLKEGEELIAEFQEHDRREQVLTPQEDTAAHISSRSAGKADPSPIGSMEAQFPCSLCGVQFRNPNTLMAHKKHYCSKLASPTSTTAASVDQDAGSVSNDTETKDLCESLQQTAFICVVCKFMTLTESDMKSHVREKHKVKQQSDPPAMSNYTGPTNGADKTFCDDCEIHFKKPESYQAHKQHYCKNRTSSNSPRSDGGGNQSISQSSSPLSPVAKECYYKKVSVFDNQALSASLATQAAAAMAAASLPFTLSSMLSLPGMGALPMMPALKMFQSPALFAQAMQSAVKATNAAATSSTPSAPHRDETPLDLTVKSDLSSNDVSTSLPTKRRASGDPDDGRPSKHRISGSSPTSPAAPIPATIPMMSPRVNGQIKPPKPERPIYRCESCSIPFYKKDVYEAHRLHYCSRRPSSSGSEKEEETVSASRPVPKPDRQSPPVVPADDRLVITYTCNKCSTSYRTIDTFKAHQCAVPPLPMPLLHCDDCSFTTQSSRILAEHIESHQKVNVMYKCKLCGYHGNTLRGMRQHGRQHMLKGEEFNDNDMEALELQPAKPLMSPLAVSAPYSHDVDEELLRLKNEPYKKRRSRKHYQKSEYMGVAISPQRKENGLQHRSRSSSPHSTSIASCTSPLQLSTQNIVQSDRTCYSPSTTVTVKQEPAESITIDPKVSVVHPLEHRPPVMDKQVTPVKRYVCSCNTSFASVSTFEAHKKLYCPHHKSQRNNPTITVNH